MAIDRIAGQLAALEMFRGLDDERLRRIAREADRIIFRDGQSIAEAGEDADGGVLIVSGKALTRAEPTTGSAEEFIEAGALIGEMAMLTEHRCAVGVVAVGDVRAVKITREALHTLMQDDPALAEHFQHRLTARLSRVALELRLIDERLAAACAMAGSAAAAG
ncbi:MAG: cyclic nucleotide-binding domain-containing protein [Hyphomicrobiaceae bacterium]|nr:cyclic nucleotide-binding domain-containing protein [Hyphomicrobiaceae bacterium]